MFPFFSVLLKRTEKNVIWRIVRVAPTSAPTGVQTLAARGTSAPEAKVLTTGPPVVPYASVIGAGLSSTLLPPSIEVAELVALGELPVSEMLKRTPGECGGKQRGLCTVEEQRLGLGHCA